MLANMPPRMAASNAQKQWAIGVNDGQQVSPTLLPSSRLRASEKSANGYAGLLETASSKVNVGSLVAMNGDQNARAR